MNTYTQAAGRASAVMCSVTIQLAHEDTLRNDCHTCEILVISVGICMQSAYSCGLLAKKHE